MHRILQNYVWLYFMKDKLIDHVSDAAEMPKDPRNLMRMLRSL